MSATIIEVIQVCVVPFICAVLTVLCKFINNKISESGNKYLELLNETIVDCIEATNQTYVDALKASGSFDEAAQQEAFEKTYTAIVSILSDEAIEYLTMALGDLDTYIKSKIEAEIKKSKTE